MEPKRSTYRNRLQHKADENEFIVLSEFMHEFAVISNHQNSLIGKPFLNLAISSNVITGIHLTLDELGGLSTYQFAKSILPHEVNFLDSVRHDISHYPKAFQFRNIKNEKHTHANQSSPIKIQITIEREKLYDTTQRHIINTIKDRIISRLKRRIVTSEIYKPPIRVSLEELYAAAITEIEFYNRGLCPDVNIQNSLCENIKSSESLKVSEALYSSIIYEKRLWWLNLQSKEVTADKRGIHYKGKCFTPVESAGYNILQDILLERDSITITVYPNNRSDSQLFWVHQMLFIPLQERKEFLVPKPGDTEIDLIIHQPKTITTMKTQKSNVARIHSYRHAKPRIEKIQPSGSDRRQYKSAVLIPKLQSNCNYLLNCYLLS